MFDEVTIVELEAYVLVVMRVRGITNIIALPAFGPDTMTPQTNLWA